MLRVALAAAVVLGCTSVAHAKDYTGDYTLSFFVDPNSNAGSVYCISLSQTRGIAGFHVSGTWSDTGGSGLAGQFLHDGKSFHLLGYYPPGGDNIEMIGKPKNGSITGAFDDFLASPVHDLDSGAFTLTPGCVSESVAAPKHGTATR